MIEIIYQKKEYSKFITKLELKKIINQISKDLGLKGNFTFSMVDDKMMIKLNKDYRNKDYNTDILTFSLEEGMVFPNQEKELGDIFVNLNQMKENALNAGVCEKEELVRLVIHGLLHLSGLDHETNNFANEKMLLKQEELVLKYNIFYQI